MKKIKLVFPIVNLIFFIIMFLVAVGNTDMKNIFMTIIIILYVVFAIFQFVYYIIRKG